MPLEFCFLASGSAGNCTVVRTPRGLLLIDLGIGPRTAARRLAESRPDDGVCLAGVSAVCLTHLDRDHFNRHWFASLVARGVRLYCHAAAVPRLLAAVAAPADRGGDGPGGEGPGGTTASDPSVTPANAMNLRAALAELVRPFDGLPFEPLPGLTLTPVPLAHDQAGSHGFLLDGFGRRAGYATDLGHVPDALLRQFHRLDLLALESNYDPLMQRHSGRPLFLQRRITGGRGHLSNGQAFEAVREVLDRCEGAGHRLPSHVVLLHRSRQCNCPNVVRRVFGRDRRLAPRLVLAEQDAPTPWLRPAAGRPLAGEQLTLAWG